MTNITAIILAGGKSARMGKDKLKLKIHQQTLIETVVFKLKDIFKNIIIVANRNINIPVAKVKVVKDIIPNCGPLGGIFTGLINSTTKYNFITAADMPFLNEKIIKMMLKKMNSYDIIIPKTNNGYEPLHCLYSKKCILPIYNLLLHNKLRIFNLLELVPAKTIELSKIKKYRLDNLSFFNINTPKDYKKAKEVMKNYVYHN